MVLHEDGIVIEPLEPDRAQKMRQTVAARFELAIGDGFARSPHDDGRLVGALNGVLPGIHASTSHAGLRQRPSVLIMRQGAQACREGGRATRSAPRLTRSGSDSVR